jgi:hypothetical protein
MGAFVRGGNKFYFRQGEICSRMRAIRRPEYSGQRRLKENLAASRKQYLVATSLMLSNNENR